MISADFYSRILGLFVFSVGGARLGSEIAEPLSMPVDGNRRDFLVSLAPCLGWRLCPWFTTRPVRAINQNIREMPVEVFFMTLLGGVIGLLVALLMAYPMAALPDPFDQFVPPGLTVGCGYIGITVFNLRSP